MNFPHLSNMIKGILLIVAGSIVLLDTMRWAPQVLHTIVLIGSIITIVWGIILANIHTGVYRLLAGKEKKEEVKQPESTYAHKISEDDEFKM